VCDILSDEEDASGSTGVIAVVDGRRGCITAANVGDSLCVLCRSGKAVVLNRMHRLDDAEERDRVKRAGGTIINNRYSSGLHLHRCVVTICFVSCSLYACVGCHRVNGILAISRAFGDIQFKPERDSKAQIAVSTPGPLKGDASLLVADPDICTEKITQGTQFAVIASDGLWDVMSPQVVVDYVLNALHTHKDLDIVNTMITKEALRRGSIDNITVSLMAFHFKAPVANSDGGHS
jgi:serine/threonine protein phosphatase PrpC